MVAKPSTAAVHAADALIKNSCLDHGRRLELEDTRHLDAHAAATVEAFLTCREGHVPTPLVSLPALSRALSVSSIQIKDEGQRLGLGSFKALGGAYAVLNLTRDEAVRRSGAPIDPADWRSPLVAEAAAQMTFACATDGNHGRSVAQGAQLVGARCVIFVHGGVSGERCAAIARYGAQIVRVSGDYDESVAEAARRAEANGWWVVSDTSYPGYEQIPRLVMQGYTALVSEALREMPEPPTHVFIQAGVGGIAAAIAAHLAIVLRERRPLLTVVEPARAACLYASAKAGDRVRIPRGEPTVMAMLECYEPSLVAWRILSRVGDAFMTVEEEAALAAMRQLAFPVGNDPAMVSGESGAVGLAGLIGVARDPALRERISVRDDSRIFLVNTEGATDPLLYEKLVGVAPGKV